MHLGQLAQAGIVLDLLLQLLAAPDGQVPALRRLLVPPLVLLDQTNLSAQGRRLCTCRMLTCLHLCHDQKQHSSMLPTCMELGMRTCLHTSAQPASSSFLLFDFVLVGTTSTNCRTGAIL
jgi:hypothetical protein